MKKGAKQIKLVSKQNETGKNSPWIWKNIKIIFANKKLVSQQNYIGQFIFKYVKKAFKHKPKVTPAPKKETLSCSSLSGRYVAY